MKEYSPSKLCSDMASIIALGFECGLTGEDKQIDYTKLKCGDKETYEAWVEIFCNDMERIFGE